MTQEEKAKRYDEAIEKAKKVLLDCTPEEQNVVEYIYPELKESEDEKLRKQVVYAINQLHVCECTKDKLKSWLEKQEQHKKFRDSIQVGDKVTRNEDGVLVNLSQLSRVAKKDEKQGEQKPADKVEHKFEIGDWVVYDHRAYQVVELPKEGYINLGLRGNGKIEFAPSTYCRPWTIQDAKDGDVLEYQGEIFIIRELKKKVIASRTIEYYCCYDGEHFINNSIYSLMDDDLVNIYPSTQEQHNLLFQKMKESGYEWDAEKKELKKIEQKPAMVEPKFKVGDIIRLKDGDGLEWTVEEVLNNGYYTIVCADRDDFIQLDDKWELVEQKPVWSEEDNIILSSIIADYERSNEEWFNAQNSLPHGRKITWLKSLKDRVQPLKQEWSEEDEEEANYIADFIENLIKKEKLVSKKTMIMEEMVDWLKSLRPQSH